MRKRLYRNASIEARAEVFLVVLDGKPATTGRGAPLWVPMRALADAIAEEWNEQRERIDLANMPLTALANAAIDRVGTHRGDVVDHGLGFGRSDLLCYRAEEPVLAARQSAIWDPLLAWVHEKHGIRLMSDAGVSFIEQPADALLRMQEIVSGFDNFRLAAFDSAAALTGSFVLALALIDGRLDADAAVAAAQVDELYQAEKWGHDDEAESRRQRILNESRAVERFVRLISTSP